ncbi:hypothetical protein L6R52_11895 [Myxococcota bacterium]|nr:hypothetical protein [Myxococcota bacterium]
MRVYLGLVTVSFALALSACAPRMQRTHFDRWNDQTAKLKEEEALQTKEKEWLRAQVGGGKAAAASKPTTMQAAEGGSTVGRGQASSSGSTTSGYGTATSTGTKSRVIKPAEQETSEEDEAIY